MKFFLIFSLTVLTILVFFDPGNGEVPERLAVSRYDIGFFETQWFSDEEPDQWKRFSQIVQEKDPEKIGINISSGFV